MELLNALLRWVHVLAGIVWVGMLYFFNFVNAPAAVVLDGETKRKMVPELMPRALFWFRWGAAWTWATGLLLLLVVFYHGGLMFGPEAGWSVAAGVMVAATFLAPLVYEGLQKSALGRNPKAFAAVAFVLVSVVLFLMARWADFTYRAFNIHLAVLFGTTMAYNVFSRIWPAQQKIVAAVKAGEAPDPSLVATAGTRSRHNTYMSVPLVWGMLNQHTTYFAGGNLGIPAAWSWVVYLAVILIGWHVVWHLYRRAAGVKGL